MVNLHFFSVVQSFHKRRSEAIKECRVVNTQAIVTGQKREHIMVRSDYAVKKDRIEKGDERI